MPKEPKEQKKAKNLNAGREVAPGVFVLEPRLAPTAGTAPPEYTKWTDEDIRNLRIELVRQQEARRNTAGATGEARMAEAADALRRSPLANPPRVPPPARSHALGQPIGGPAAASAGMLRGLLGLGGSRPEQAAGGPAAPVAGLLRGLLGLGGQ